MTERRALILTFGAIAALFIACSAGPALLDKLLPAQPAVSTFAKVIDIKGGHVGRSGRQPPMIVTFQAANGWIGRDAIPLDEFECRVGDTIGAVRQGATLELDAKACRIRR